MERHGAFMLEMAEGNFLCVNLFHAKDEYIGCLYIDQTKRAVRMGEEALAEYLSRMIEKVIETTPSLQKNEHSSVREVLQLVMKELPLSQNQKMLLKSRSGKEPYVCISIHYLKRFSSLPVSYICSVFETMLKESVLFEQNNTILGLIPVSSLQQETGETIESFASCVREMQLCVGISNEFTDLYLLRTYYLQAEAAIENGQLYQKGNDVFHFSDFALLEMISNSLGSFPVEAYFPDGFRKLLEHDCGGGISYLETLSVFLEENMSYAQAARRLFIHRSTLIERISRIEKELSLDFGNPDERLQMQILLKALQIEARMKAQSAKEGSS